MIKKLHDLVDELGWIEAAFYRVGIALQKYLRPAELHRYVLVAQPVPSARLLAAHRGRDIQVRILSRHEPIFAEVGLAPSVVAYRFAQGAVCFGAFHNQPIIGCLWLCLGPDDEDEVRCRFIPLPEGRTCWDLGIYIAPNYRGGSVLARLWDDANVKSDCHHQPGVDKVTRSAQGTTDRNDHVPSLR